MPRENKMLCAGFPESVVGQKAVHIPRSVILFENLNFFLLNLLRMTMKSIAEIVFLRHIFKLC
jgi:hypothetical protein